MEQLFSIASAIAVLGILIFVHELGHFLFAKFFKVGVVEFAIGFGRILSSFRYGETRYTIRMIPLGGFVKMVGEDLNDPIGTSPAKSEDGEQEQEPLEAPHPAMLDESRWFSKKPLYQRALIVFAGPLFNLLFAALAGTAVLATYGAPQYVDDPVIGVVFEGQPAFEAGLQMGDRVLEVNGEQTTTWEEFAQTIWSSGGKPLNVVVEREGSIAEIDVTPVQAKTELDVVFGDDGESELPFRIGVGPSTDRVPVSLTEAVIGGTTQTLVWCEMILRGLYAMITGQISASNIGGPIQIVQHAAESAEAGIERVMSFMIFLSVSLAVLNLLPIPVLDGGHLFFFLIEAIRRKPLSIKVQMVAQQLGMLALITLMLFAISNDLQRVFLS